MLEEVVAGATRGRPDVTVDARILDAPGRDDPKLEPGLDAGALRGVQQRTADAVQTGGPGAQEAPVDDEHGAILAAGSAIRATVRPVTAVSVVIPVRNGARTLPACLDALSRQEHDC